MKRLSDEAADTINKVHELAAYREDCLNKNVLPLIFPYACKKFGISPSTAQRLAPELFEKWNDINFHWERGTIWRKPHEDTRSIDANPSQ